MWQGIEAFWCEGLVFWFRNGTLLGIFGLACVLKEGLCHHLSLFYFLWKASLLEVVASTHRNLNFLVIREKKKSGAWGGPHLGCLVEQRP